MSSTGAEDRPVDLDHLAVYTGGDQALNAEILSLFLDQSASLVRQLQSVLEAGDQKVWRETNHALKGAAKGIGAFAMADAAAVAEPLVLSQSAAEAVAALERLNTRMRAVHLFIEAYLGR